MPDRQTRDLTILVQENPATDKNSVKRDLAIMIPAAIEAGIPVIIGTAGGSGGRPHVDLTIEIVKEIAKEQSLTFKLAVIQSEFDKEFVKEKIRKGDISPTFPCKRDFRSRC